MRYKHLLSEEQLDEVRMSPSALRQFANSPEAEGIQAGFEAELVFPGMADSDGGESEPDYDADERAYSIEDIINFFENDDYGYGIGGRQADRLRDELDEAWMEYFDDAMYSEFNSEAISLIRDVIENTDWDPDEHIREYLSVESDLSANEIDEMMAAARKATSTRQLSPEYIEARKAVDEELDARAEESLDEQDRYYEEALDNFRDNFTGVSEEDWLRENYRYMSDVADAFGLDWPVLRYEGNEGGFNEYEADRLASDLEKTIGMKVVASGGYHSTSRKPGLWIIESDSSLDPDDSEDMPAEIVSPPMPLNQCLEMLEKFWAWADTHDAYTNRTTGFHMGVSLPRVGGNVDFIKLALFLGDEHVLKEFGRMSNTYAEAAMRKIRTRIKTSPEQINDAMKLMQHGLIELAERSMSRMGGGKDKGFGKYTSINPKGKYIEFRSAGGEDYHKDIKKLQNTLMRYAQAMSIAANPSAERKEYYKKLYKLISPEGKNPAMELFAKFASGNISKEELKKEWAEAALEKDAPQELVKGTWKVFDKATGKPLEGYQYSGYTEPEALALVKQAMSPGSSMFGFRKDFSEKYELRNVSASTGKWAIIDTNTGETLEVVDSESRGPVADMAAEKYAGKEYYIEPVPADTKPKLSRRAELAKRIKAGKDAQEPEAEPTASEQRFTVRNARTGDTTTITAPSRLRANAMVMDLARRMGTDADDFTIEPAEQQTTAPVATTPVERQPQQATTISGVPMWEIYVRSSGEPVTSFPDHNQTAAWSTAQQWLRDAYVPEQNWNSYSVRPQINNTTAAQQPAQPVPGSTQDIQQQRAAGEFTGSWKIVNSNTGEELHRFGGVGNVQADANRVAQNWLQRSHYDDPVEVVPVMAESLKLTKSVLNELDNWLGTMKLPKGFSK